MEIEYKGYIINFNERDDVWEWYNLDDVYICHPDLRYIKSYINLFGI